VPEVAIAGFGRITDKVVAVNGQAVVRPVLPIVVATDHRVNDGAHLGEFVNTLEDLLQSPSEWAR
jgi:pyruvate dehydrogenase E2 component (dihydrolipoamide acetyltransferase)